MSQKTIRTAGIGKDDLKAVSELVLMDEGPHVKSWEDGHDCATAGQMG
jgi:hypothetical protein